METLPYTFAKQIPVVAEADVVVVGGGPGGLGASVMAARMGVSVVLVERYGVLGGMASIGEIHPFMANHAHGRTLDRPVYTEWIAKMQPYLGPVGCPTKGDVDEANGLARQISKDAAALAAEDLCLEAGVRLMYHHALADVLQEGRAVQAVVCLSRSGLVAVRGKQFVDCTGDGELGFLSGCRFEEGGPSGWSQPMTLCFKLSGVDMSLVPNPQEVSRLYQAAKERGQIDNPREDVLQFQWLEPSVVHFNTTRVTHRKATDGLDLSEAEIEARRQLRQLLAFLRAEVPGYQNARVFSMGSQIGVRESRRIKGLATVTRDDFRRAARFEDGIARVSYPIDIHNPVGTGTEHERLPPNAFYEIPFGCVVAADVPNLLVGGRAISGDHAAHSSYRVMPPACSLGQAAGVAAAMAVRDGVEPGQLDGREVRRQLKAMGANL